MAMNIVESVPGEYPIVSWIKRRVDDNLNFLSIADGPTGIGKSWSMLSLAYEIDKDFNEEQIVFALSEVMKVKRADWFLKKKYKVLMFDEMQIASPNRKWQSPLNQLINSLVSTFRHENIILLSTSPYLDMIDKQTQKLLHVKFETRGHDKSTGETDIRPYILQYNSEVKKFYNHSLFVRRKDKDGRISLEKEEITVLNKPPMHLIVPYEQKKKYFTGKLDGMIEKNAIKFEAECYDTKDELIKPQLNIQSMQPDIWRIASLGYKRIEDIRQKMILERGRDVKISLLGRNIIWMRKRGFDIKQFKQISR